MQAHNLEFERQRKRYLSILRYLHRVRETGKIKYLTRSHIRAIRSRLSRCLCAIRKYFKLGAALTCLSTIAINETDAQCQMNRLPVPVVSSFSTGQDYNTPFDLADIDMDGDLDLVVGGQGIRTYENSNGVWKPLYGVLNPFNNINEKFAHPAFVDIDDDGDSDFFLRVNGEVQFYENRNGTFTQVFFANPLKDINEYSPGSLAFVDIDKDDDFDLFMGKSDGTIAYFRNDSGVFNSISGASNPLNVVSVGQFSTPAFIDIDKDGDLDAFVGEYVGKLNFFRNDNGDFVEVDGVGNSFDGFDFRPNTYPRFADIDMDGDLDLFLGERFGRINLFQNSNNDFTRIPNFENPLFEVDVPLGNGPNFGDLDKDGDLDFIVGTDEGRVKSYVNTNGVFNEVVDSNNPFDMIDVDRLAKPVLIDIDATDSDTELDLVVGTWGGRILYYRNFNGSFVLLNGFEDPFFGVDIGYNAAPAFIDFDRDGDLDAFVGADDGTIHYFENNPGVLSFRAFNKIEGTGNPFNGVDVGDRATPAFSSLGPDNILVGNREGKIKEFIKVGNKYTPVSDSPSGVVDVFYSSTPTLVDNSWDLYGIELVVGGNNGRMFVFSDQGGRSNVWQGPFTSNWHGPASNWELMALPRSGCDDVYINDGATLQVGQSGIAEGRTLTIKDGGQFEVKSGAQLIINLDPVVTDFNGKHYKIGKIGGDIWMLENLRTQRFNDGSFIGQIDANATWAGFNFAARSRYANTDDNIIPYGYLYNGYAVEDPRLCPSGWHVATVADWEALLDYLGSETVAGGLLKEAGNTHWALPNEGATDQFEFAAVPGGNRRPDGSYTGITQFANYWAIDQPSLPLKDYNIRYNTIDIGQLTITDKKWGLSVRCVKN